MSQAMLNQVLLALAAQRNRNPVAKNAHLAGKAGKHSSKKRKVIDDMARKEIVREGD